MRKLFKKHKVIFAVLIVYLTAIFATSYIAASSTLMRSEAAGRRTSSSFFDSLFSHMRSHTKKTRTADGSKRSVAFGFAVEPITKDRIVMDEQKIGKDYGLLMLYIQWGNSKTATISQQTLAMLSSQNKTPIITWEPWDPTRGVTQPAYTLRAITKGRYDQYIKSTADTLKSYGEPVFLRFAHEMNGNWYPWSGVVNGNTPRQYIAAWKHVHSIFDAEGASNVVWVWSPNASNVPSTNSFSAYYPGDNQVDWVGLNGYNFGTTQPGNSWQSFDEIFGDAYDAITKLTTKPLMIAETASTEQGGDKAAWIQDALSVQIPKNYDRIQAAVWFDITDSHEWQIDSSRQTLKQLKEALSSSLYTEQSP